MPDSTSATNNGTFGASGYQPGTIAYEGLDPSQDSITQYFRSFENTQAKSGQEKSATGQQILGGGMQGLDQSNHDLQPVVDYFTKLLGGNRDEVSSAISPEIDQISNQYDQIRKMTSETAARGGGKASAAVTNPYQQIQLISQLMNRARSGAAAGLTNATAQEQQGAGIRGQLGLGESNLGFQDLQSAIQSTEARKGFNIQESGANKQLASNLLSALI